MARAGAFKKFGYTWVTLFLFAISLIGHWIFSWFAYVNEQKDLHAPIQGKEYVIEAMRDTLENWQSEFLQLVWQVAGLAFLLHVGSPQSREGDERKEAKLDLILRKLDPQNAEELIRELDIKHMREGAK